MLAFAFLLMSSKRSKKRFQRESTKVELMEAGYVLSGLALPANIQASAFDSSRPKKSNNLVKISKPIR